MNHEMIAVILKNDTLATEYIIEHFPETEIYRVDESVLQDDTLLKEECEKFKQYADTFTSVNVAIASGVGNLKLALFLYEYAQSRNGYYYMIEPHGVIKVA